MPRRPNALPRDRARTTEPTSGLFPTNPRKFGSRIPNCSSAFANGLFRFRLVRGPDDKTISAARLKSGWRVACVGVSTFPVSAACRAINP